MATTAVEVVSPARVAYSGEAEMVVCRTFAGEAAFLADHAPFLAALVPCVVRMVPEAGDEVKVAISGGFVEVRDNKVTVLADTAELGGEVDVAAARAALADAERRVRDDGDDQGASADLASAAARLEAAGAQPAAG